METKEENKIVELLVVRMNDKGELDLIYSDYLVGLISCNPYDKIKETFNNAVGSVLDNIASEIEKVKKQGEEK